jgi:hypothetical protein
VSGVGHVSGNRRDVCAHCQLIAHGSQSLGVPRSENEVPAVIGERTRQRESQAARGAGNQYRPFVRSFFHTLLLVHWAFLPSYKLK